jgi:AraC family transcriptional regulator, arabinose operon regulatory protein
MAKLTGVMAVLTNGSRFPTLRVEGLPAKGLFSDVQVGLVGLIKSKQYRIDHTFDFFAVSLVVTGSGSFRVDDEREQPVAPGSFFVEYPGPVFHYGPREGTTWDEYTMALVGPGVERWRKLGLLACDGVVHTVKNVGPHVERYRTLRKLVRRGRPGDADRAIVEVERLLLELAYARTNQVVRDERSARLEPILDYCSAHRSEDVDFPALARRHGMSYSTLRQEMRKILGVSPQKHLISLRCDAAKQMLAHTELTVKEVSDRLGWPDPYTMSRAFKRAVGVSPLTYRKRHVPWAR